MVVRLLLGSGLGGALGAVIGYAGRCTSGTIPLRWIDIATGQEEAIVRFSTKRLHDDSALRIDPHPAWDRAGRYVTFNALVDGTRQVLIADMQGLMR